MVLLVLVASPAVAQFDFSLKDLDNKIHKLSDYKGSWVLVNFWATWCPPCREEIPDLSSVHDSSEKITVIGVNFHESDNVRKITEFLEPLLLDFPILLLPKPDTITGIDSIVALPTSLLINPEGELLARFSGVVDVEALTRYIDRNAKK